MTQKPRAADPGATGSAPGGSAPGDRQQAAAGERVVIRDKRKIEKAGSGSASGAEPTAPAGAAGGAQAATGESGGTEPGATESGPTAEAGGTATPAGTAAASGTAPASGGTAASGGTPASGARPTSGAKPAPGTTPPPTGAEDVEVEIEAVIEAEHPSEAAATAAAGPLGAELAALRTELDERTRDLQRISAEYANYRKRVDRDRGLAAEQTTGTVLAALLPVLDDLDRAREHGDLVGPFGTVAEQLTAALGKFGLTAFGEKGDPFDPTRHEAVAHLTSAEVSESTCVDVMRRGYLLGERLLRPALVAVADPE
jgi:molecular chaperone GrpE